MFVRGHVQTGPRAVGENHVHVAPLADAPQQSLFVFGAAFFVPARRIVAVLEEFDAFASRVFGQPVPHGAGVVRVGGDGHVAVFDEAELRQPLRGGGEDLLVVRIAAAFHVDGAPFFQGGRLSGRGRGAASRHEGKDQNQGKAKAFHEASRDEGKADDLRRQ